MRGQALRPPPQRLKRARRQKKSDKNHRQVVERVTRIEQPFRERLHVRCHRHVGKNPRPRRAFVAAGPPHHPKHQADAEGGGCRDDLILCERRDKHPNGQHASGLQDHADVGDPDRLPVGLTVFEKKCQVEYGHQQQAPVEGHGSEPFSADNFQIADRRGDKKFDRARALLFGEETHRDHRNEEESDHVDVGKQRPDQFLVEVHRERLAAHLRFHRVKDEGTQGVPKEKSKNNREHRQQEISHRRREIAVDLFPENHKNVAHQAGPVATGSSLDSTAAGSPVSCKKISSRLTAAGRSSFKSQPDSTTARARSPRTKLSLWLSISKMLRFSCFSLKTMCVMPGTRSKRCWMRAESTSTPRPAISMKSCSAPRARFWRLLTESFATKRPLLMMSTDWQVCSTSGRMCVLRMMV